MTLSTKRVVIFGGSGFLGRYLVPLVSKTGAWIQIATRHPDRANFLKVSGTSGQIVTVGVNVEEEESVRSVIEGMDVVINLMGIIVQTRRWTFQKVHVEVPERLGRLCRDLGVRDLVHVSALGADMSSRSAYARSKSAGEQVLKNVFPEVRILRPSLVFGAEDRFFNLFAHLMLLMPIFPVFGGGQTKFQPVYVHDCAQAIMAVLDNPDTQGKTYALGGPKVYTFRELLELVLEVIERKRWLYSVPWWLVFFKATLLELLPSPMLTRDQVYLLQQDNVITPDMLTLENLGLTPTSLELILPTYLERFRSGGTMNKFTKS